MAAMVKTVEYIEVTQGSASTLSTINLTKGQNYENCVPFMTLHGGQDYQDSHCTDVYFGGTVVSGVINFQRATHRSTAIYIKCFVVEFDSAEVKVQQGSFSTLVGGTTTAYNTPSSFDQTKTAMRHYWRSSSGTNRWDAHTVRGRVLATGTQVDMYRNYNSGTVSGHYFLFEDISAGNDHFSVYHNSDSITGTASNKRPPAGTRDPSKTFLLASLATTSDDYYPDGSTVRFYNYFKSFWRCDRSTTRGTIYPAWQLVTFNDTSRVYIAHQREVSQSSPTTNNTWSWDRPVNLNLSIIAHTMPMGLGRGTTTTTTQIDSLWMSWKFESNTSARQQRNSDGGGNTTYQGVAVIDWGGMVVNTGTNPAPLDPDITPVKSVETFRIDNHTYWRYHDLTKGQVVANCAVFSSTRGEGATQQREHKAITWLREPGIIMNHCNDAGGNHYSDISVVEFYPDQVKVQSGEFDHWGTTDERRTLASGVNSLEKAFCISSWETNEATYWSRVSVRTRFIDVNTVQFYRHDAGNMIDGAYYVIEDLTGNWIRVYHALANPTTYSNVWPSWYAPYYARMPIGSYAYSGDDVYVDSGSCRFGHTPSGGRVFAHRQYNRGTMYVSFQTVNFLDNRRHTQPIGTSMDTSTSSTTSDVSAVHSGHETAFSVYNPCQNDTGRGDTTGSDDYRGVYHSFRLTTGNTVVENSRDTPAGVTLSPSYGGLIDWIGAGHPDADEKFNRPINTSSPTNSLVRNIYHVEGTTGSSRYSYLPNGMRAENCVPFASWRAGTSNGYQVYLLRNYYMDAVNDVLIGNGESAGNVGDMDESVYVVEFDPRQVKVQQFYHSFTGTSSAPNIPEEVDLTRTFMQFHMVADDWGSYQSRNKVRGKFNSSTQLHFQRENSANAVFLHIYLVECLQDQWYVAHVANDTSETGTNVYDYPNYGGGWGQQVRFLIGSYAVTTDAIYADRSQYRVYPRQDHAIQWNKDYASENIYRRACEVIEFNPNRGIRNGGYWTDLSSGVTSETKGSVGHYWDLSRSVANTSHVGSQGRCQGTAANDATAACHKVVLTDSNTATITNYNGGVSSWNWFQWIEWPEYKTHYFEGTITERNVPISRQVACFRADTDEMMDSTVSASGTGYYRLETTHSGTHYIICQDDDPGVDYNHLVLGKMDPYPIVSGTVWGDGYDGGRV